MWVIDSETNHNDPLCPRTSPQASRSSLFPPVSLSSHLFSDLLTKKKAYGLVHLLKFHLSQLKKQAGHQGSTEKKL